MTICLVCSEYPPRPHGGIGTVTRLLAHGLVARGHEVRVVGVYGPGTTTETVTDDAGVRVWRVAEPTRWRGGWVAGRAALRRQIAEWMRTGAVDVVEVPDWQGWAAGWPRGRTPVVARLHGSMTYFAREQNSVAPALTRHLEKRSLARATAWAATSRYTARQTTAYFGGLERPMTVLPNPVDECVVDDAPRDPSAVVFSGTLTPKKGVLALAEAWSRVVDVHPQAVLHCYGKDCCLADGTSVERAMLGRMTADARRQARFHGQVARVAVRHALARATIAVCPSFAEAFAMAPLEAMAAGCATVSTRLGSGPEQFEHGRHGLLVDPREPSTIVEALVHLLSSAEARRRLAEAGQAWVRERYGIADLARRNEEWYAECIQAHGAGTTARARRSVHAGASTRTS